MTLYTPYSAEEIFYSVSWAQQSNKNKIVEISGIKMEIEFLDEGEARIVRIVSTNPSDYLHAKYQPGSMLKMSF